MIIIQKKLEDFAKKIKNETNEIQGGILTHDYMEILFDEPSLKDYIEYLERQSKIQQDRVDLNNLKIIDVKSRNDKQECL